MSAMPWRTTGRPDDCSLPPIVPLIPLPDMRLRTVLGCAIALLVVLGSAPAAWLPWNHGWHALATSWWMLPICASSLLLVAAALLPAQAHPDGPLEHRQESVALGLGFLLLLEPVLHLAVLGLLAHRQTPGAEAILLPSTLVGTPGTLLLQVIVLCLFVPLAEEIFFRGRLLPWLAGHFGRWSALSLSSLAFAVAHGSPVSCLLALPIGFVLGWLRLTRRDLGACVVVHQVHNGLVLLAGPALFTVPLSAAVLVGGGLTLLILAAVHGRMGWKALPIGLALGTALAVAMPPALALKDQLWAAGTARLLRTNPDNVLERIDRERRRGRLTTVRCAALRQHLAAHPATPLALTVRMLLDGSAAQAGTPAEAEAMLEAAARIAVPPMPLAEAAAAIGIAWPAALANQATINPQMVATWLGREHAPAAIIAAHGPERRRLLAALEQVWPGRLGSILLNLPASAVTPIDQRHLRVNYPEAKQLIEALDPDRQAAWKQ